MNPNDVLKEVSEAITDSLVNKHWTDLPEVLEPLEGHPGVTINGNLPKTMKDLIKKTLDEAKKNDSYDRAMRGVGE